MKTSRILMTLFIITLTACRSQGPVNQAGSYEEIFSNADINRTITVSAGPEFNTYTLDDAVMISVLLESDHTVIFNDHDIKIYVNQDNQWIQIQNQNPHPDMAYVIEPTETPELRFADVFVFPNLGTISVPVMLRIVVVGNIYDNGVRGKPVFAYVDVTLHP